MTRRKQHEPPSLPEAQTNLARPQAQALNQHHYQKARQEEGQGEMTVSYLPLIRAQQKPHGPKVVDRHFSSSLDILAAGRAARERLMGLPAAEEPKPTPKLALVPEPKPIEQAADVESDDVPDLPAGVPLDLLGRCSWKFLLALAAVRNGVTPADIISVSRRRDLAGARHDAMALIYQHTNATRSAVARLLERDHATVLHALRKLGAERKLIELPLVLQAKYRHKKGPERDARLKAVDDVIRQGYVDGLSCEKIADQAGVSKAYVRARAFQLKLKHPHFRAAPSRLLKIMSPDQLKQYRYLTHNQRLTAAEARQVIGVGNA